MRYAGLLFVVCSALAPCVAAQATLPITAGQRVRLTLDAGRPAVVGLLLARDVDSLRLQRHPEALPTVIARSAVTTAQVSRGRHGHAGTGARTGLVAGGVVGGAAGAGCSGDWLCPGAGGGALLLGALGAGFGTLVGVLVRSERWEQVYENRVRVGFASPGKGLGVALAVVF